MFTKNTFKSVLQSFSRNADDRREILLGLATFCMYNAGKHGNKAPIQQWMESAAPKVWHAVAKQCGIDRVKDYTQEMAEEAATEIVDTFLAKQAKNAEKAKAARAAKAALPAPKDHALELAQAAPTAASKAAPKAADTAPSAATTPERTLRIDGQHFDLTPAEAEAMLQMLRQMRANTEKPASRTARKTRTTKTTRKAG